MKEFAFGLLVICFIASFATTAAALDKDLVLYLSFDEGKGDVVADQSDKGNHGTIMGDPIWTEGKYGKALEFNGSTDYVEVPMSASLEITGAVTVMAWIKIAPEYPNQYWGIAGVNRVGGQTEDAYYLNVGYWNKEHDKVSLGIIGAGVKETPAQGKTAISQEVWAHAAGVFSPGKFMRVYLDGELDGEITSVPDEIHTAPTPLTVGAIFASTGYSLKGTIDEVRVYSRALTQEEIQNAMRGTQPVAFAGKSAITWGRIKAIL